MKINQIAKRENSKEVAGNNLSKNDFKLSVV